MKHAARHRSDARHSSGSSWQNGALYRGVRDLTVSYSRQSTVPLSMQDVNKAKGVNAKAKAENAKVHFRVNATYIVYLFWYYV